MGRFKTLSIVIFFFLIIGRVHAISLYGGASYSFAGVISENDFYNGSTDWAPGLVIGTRSGRLALEAFFKRYNLENETDALGQKFQIQTTNVHMGFGLRLELAPKIDFLLGVNNQNIASYVQDGNGNPASFSKQKDKALFSWYIGGGTVLPLSEKFDSRIDLSYHKGDLLFGLFIIDFSITYDFLSS